MQFMHLLTFMLLVYFGFVFSQGGKWWQLQYVGGKRLEI